ncbi:hypothetical protein QGM71_01035 [Virgibacillus sp. C22-A2]|uniref:Uncharacterized protein n=1 Tax=Virgibacillus tibetensis TaxID=3042313 RepID=A0ABU6K9Q8_9BACI|nr:hypothetical protein [Virgibacillus sp. C22-A2]
MGWTYADKLENWCNEEFATKQEAKEHGMANHDEFLVGKLIETDEHLVYEVEQIEEVTV